jgi:hypothetical protein
MASIDLLQFRQALTTLTMQVDELERIKLEYYFSNLESEQANLQLILQKTSTIVRAEVDIYERIANKGLNDTILEPVSFSFVDRMHMMTPFFISLDNFVRVSRFAHRRVSSIILTNKTTTPI